MKYLFLHCFTCITSTYCLFAFDIYCVYLKVALSLLQIYLIRVLLYLRGRINTTQIEPKKCTLLSLYHMLVEGLHHAVL